MEFLDLGVGTRTSAFVETLELQRTLHSDVAAGIRPNTIIFVEHASVYTAGRRTRKHEYPQNTHVIDIDRGGKITWHGPGQLVAYPIVRLPEPLDVVAYVRTLEQAVMNVCSDFSLNTHRVTDRSGVWHRSPTLPHDNKICALGVRVSQGVTMHGLALNCSNSLEPFNAITPCGISDAGVTTLSTETSSLITPAQALASLEYHLTEQLKELGVSA
ncbi:lipoyl(octanoyl) transferase LipB [Timonella sp. A28]|uniref:lipoyl(octanoyl) transferase LipB n=1 Tax=Timonella sp. A28 TaxID=3442640 RepID=UPI003EBC1A87